MKGNNKHIKAVYSDVDGTLTKKGCLFLNKDDSYNLKAAESIIELLRNKIDLILTSGQTSLQLRSINRLLGFSDYIAEIGSILVINRHKMHLFEKHIPTSAFEYIKNLGIIEDLVNSYNLELHSSWHVSRECSLILKGNIEVDDVSVFLKKKYPGLKIISNGKIADDDTKYVYHVLFEECSKRNAILKHRKLKNIKKEECVMIGDSIEDVKAHDMVKTMYVTKNGYENDKKLREYIEEKENIVVLEESYGEGFASAISNVLKKFSD